MFAREMQSPADESNRALSQPHAAWRVVRCPALDLHQYPTWHVSLRSQQGQTRGLPIVDTLPCSVYVRK